MLKAKIKNRFIRMILIALFVLIFVTGMMAVLSTVSFSTLKSAQATMDKAWWSASFIRWAVLALLVIKFLPWYLNKQQNKYQTRDQLLNEEYVTAEAKGASYESLRELEFFINDNKKLHSTFARMIKNYRWIAVGLIGFEIIAVQLPHWI